MFIFAVLQIYSDLFLFSTTFLAWPLLISLERRYIISLLRSFATAISGAPSITQLLGLQALYRS